MNGDSISRKELIARIDKIIELYGYRYTEEQHIVFEIMKQMIEEFPEKEDEKERFKCWVY